MKRLAMIAALGLVCVGPVVSAQPTEGGSINSKVEYVGELRGVEVVDLRAKRSNNLLRVQFKVYSANNSKFQYRFRWLDADGFAVWEAESWKPLVISAGQDKVIEVSAPTFKASDFKIELKDPKTPDPKSDRGGVADNPPYR